MTEIKGELFVCDRCGRETDHGWSNGCGRKTVRLCIACKKKQDEEVEVERTKV